MKILKTFLSLGAVTSSPLFIAVGQDSYTGDQPPLLASNSDSTWAVKKVVDLPTRGVFYAASCTSNDPSALCVAVGQDWSKNETSPPLLAVSTDGSKSWAVKNVSAFPQMDDLDAVSCVANGSNNTMCAAVGSFVTVSFDGGKSWLVKPVAGIPEFSGSYLDALSCFPGDDNHTVCAAAGYNDQGIIPPVLVTSVDNGNNWALQPILNSPKLGGFESVSCTGKGSDAICAAGGWYNTGPEAKEAPLLATSRDGAKTWAVQKVPGVPRVGSFFGVSCTGDSESNTMCIAAGDNLTANLTTPFLAFSVDGANTWITKDIPGLPDTGTLSKASCSGNGDNAVCVVAGKAAGFPFLASTKDRAKTWIMNEFLNLPPETSFQGVSCTENTCTAVAGGLPNFPMFLFTSKDKGDTWTQESVQNIPKLGYFWSVSGGGQNGDSHSADEFKKTKNKLFK